ncbi:MAG: low-specificity L-threonine aldolase [Sedimentisphaerales bacterium]|nr:low-specificity L-threonine aldolase [Sedimentisphaerales bacterium]
MRIVDLRSDTVTLPSPAMRKAMAEAELGDDVFGEDPTVNRLQERSAERMGTEAALFVPSGTMANLVSVLTHCRRGEEVILGNQAHMFRYEAGSMAAVGSIHPHTIPNQPDGTLALSDIRSAVRPGDVHFPRTRLILLENTHNRCGGAVLSVEYTASVVQLAREKELCIHLDGARIFNAAVSLGVDVKDLMRGIDSVCFCLSKGLAAPVGSVICGSRDFIAEARRNRKVVGGGMRQAGILAAAGLVAMEEMVDRLAEDHANARKLAEGLGNITGLVVEARPATNMVYLRLNMQRFPATELVGRMKDRGILFLTVGENRFRLVTHYGITDADIDYTLTQFFDCMRE